MYYLFFSLNNPQRQMKGKLNVNKKKIVIIYQIIIYD